MLWTILQDFLRHISAPLRKLLTAYSLLLALFTLLRLLRLNGLPLLDLANTFAPYLYMPLLLSFPLSIIVTRQGAASPGKAKKAPATQQAPPRWPVLLQIAALAIGLYWFALPALAKATPPPHDDSFTVLTFNIQGSNSELQQATDWLLQVAPDILVLQETSAGYDQRLAPLYAAYAHEAHITGNVRIFSQHEILQRTVIPLDPDPKRSALRLLLHVRGRQLAVYGLHLSLPLRPRERAYTQADIGLSFFLRYDEARRNAQIRRFLAHIAQEQLPYVVAGDFNMSDSSLIYSEMAAQMGDVWRGAGSGAGRTWPLAQEIGLPRLIHPILRIDYIWHSPQLRPSSARLGEAIGSDHLPLSATFAWR